MSWLIRKIKEKRLTYKLSSLDEKEIKFLTLKGQKFPCKCVDVYDGDTITLIVPFHDTFYKMKCRLYGIDTPEKRTKDGYEKKCAIISTNRMKEFVENKIIWVECIDWDKYGRLLANIYPTRKNMKRSTNSFNKQMIDEKLAYAYDGGTKVEFSDWQQSFNSVKSS